ncbi:MAG: energy transducer TonB [Ferruginibacter sp.]|nr:energy transducer TonB [Ferruginibacter sp.]MCB0709832.1 energy transducer TonB [Chitinophagaceae bacterium]
MNSKLIMKSDILDIVFEHRNKEYGAYCLRKYYPQRIKLAIGFMLLVSITFSVLTLMPVKKTMHTSVYIIPETKITKVDFSVKQPEVKKEIVKKEKISPKKNPQVKQRMYVSNTLIVPNTEKTDSIKELKPDELLSNTTVQTAGKQKVVVPVKIGEAPGDGNTETQKMDVNKPMNENEVDVLPSYPGGINALMKFLQKNLQTPDELQSGETVNVRIRFVVGNNGKLQSFVTIQDGGDVFNNEVIRVLKKMPDWNPGKSKGKEVAVYYTIPVKFVSEN